MNVNAIADAVCSITFLEDVTPEGIAEEYWDLVLDFCQQARDLEGQLLDAYENEQDSLDSNEV